MFRFRAPSRTGGFRMIPEGENDELGRPTLFGASRSGPRHSSRLDAEGAVAPMNHRVQNHGYRIGADRPPPDAENGRDAALALPIGIEYLGSAANSSPGMPTPALPRDEGNGWPAVLQPILESDRTHVESRAQGLVDAMATFAPPASAAGPHSVAPPPWLVPMLTGDGGP